MVPLLAVGGLLGRDFVPVREPCWTGPGGHETTSTVVILDSSRRMASMAV